MNDTCVFNFWANTIGHTTCALFISYHGKRTFYSNTSSIFYMSNMCSFIHFQWEMNTTPTRSDKIQQAAHSSRVFTGTITFPFHFETLRKNLQKQIQNNFKQPEKYVDFVKNITQNNHVQK